MNINDLQISTGNWHTGLTQSNHLNSFFFTNPALASSIVTRVYNQMNDEYKTPLSYLTTGAGRSKELPTIQYRWPLMGDDEKAITITGNFGDGGSTPGIAGSTFRVRMAEKWFVRNDVLLADSPNYKCRVVEDPYQDGNDYVYVLKLVTNDQTLYIDSTLLTAGKEFSKEYNLASHDYSTESGETTFATPFWMENYMSTYRKKYSVSGAASSRVLEIALMDPKSGKTATTWVKYAEWVFWAQFMEEIERGLWYGNSNISTTDGSVSDKDKNGNPIYSSAGVESQIAPSNIRLYTKLTERVIRNYLNDLSFGGNDPGPKKYVAFCGRGFMDLFDQAMKDSASKYTLVDSKFITGSGADLKLSGQFKTYVGLNSDEITLKELPLYNSTVRNRQLHPDTGLPAESYKATFLNFKIGTDGESNIMKVHTPGREMVSAYIEGLYGPYGPKKNSSTSSTADGYMFTALSECGIMVKDPTNCGQLKLDILGL